ncbi:VOC family protein [Saxibacter everestensis]|uniref:VOC family protein n=1 Tax=Saxibacter everestensis TaxID=2909229 RepID=A0ABY8QRS5_9MICO|nr:VOC family protein [Brevibacteriaceae bacterium ZFBP1038]
MTSRISHTTVDCANAYQLSLFWAAVLGYAQDPENPDEPGDEECMIFGSDSAMPLLFIEVPEGKQAKNRLHLDLRPIDRTQSEEIERVLALGGVEVEDRRTTEGGWMVIADPEGNEFCILRSDSEIAGS